MKFGFQQTSVAVDGYSKLRFDTHLVEVRWWKVTFSEPVWAWGKLRKTIRAKAAPPPIGIYWKTSGEIKVDLLVVATDNHHYGATLSVKVAPNPTPSATATPSRSPSVRPTPTHSVTASARPTARPTSSSTRGGTIFAPSVWSGYVQPKFRVKQINCVQNGWSYNDKLARWVANWQVNFLMQAYDGNFVRKSATSSFYKYLGRTARYNWWFNAITLKSMLPPADAANRKMRVREVTLRVWSPNWRPGTPADDTKLLSTKVLFHIKRGSCIWRDPVPPTS